MSWLNFNDSLNSLKGQITNFANNVLAEEELESRGDVDSKESETRCENELHGNAYNNEDAWTWSAVESKTDQLKTDETITNLKKKIEELQNENRYLVTSLDQLDQNHQQNTEELVKMKSKLSEELEIVTEKYEILNMKYNKLALAENGYKKKINELKNKCVEFSQQKPSDNVESNIIDFSQKCKYLEQENFQMKEKIAVLEANSENSGKNLDSDAKLASMIEELQMENKALKIALQTTTELKTTQNYEKIIGEYENEIAQLRSELENFKSIKSLEETCTTQELSSKTDTEEATINVTQGNSCNDLVDINEDIDQSKKEYEQLKKEMTKVQTELDSLKTRESDYETRIHELEYELNEVKKDGIDLEKNYIDLQEINRELKKSKYESEEVLEQQVSDLKEELSKKEINLQNTEEEVTQRFLLVLSETFKHYLKDKPSIPDDLKVFTELLSNSMKLEFDALETKFQELNQSKIELQNEKDEEIERLSKDSERLKQELSNKSKEIRDIEEECSQLMKNNELLISRLEEFKDTGLQTIFESNEDNVDSLEKQLDAASRRIENLEILVSEKENENKQLAHGGGLTQNLEELAKQKEYLEVENEELKNKLKATESERDNCRIVIDKMRLDFETTEYQFSEMNVNLETLSEEIEKHKMRIDLLVSENENLKSLSQEDSKNDKELETAREELGLAKEANNILQKKIEESEERFQLEGIELEKECEQLRTKLDNMSIEKFDLEKTVGESSAALASLQKHVETYESEKEILRSVTGLNQEEFGISEVAEHIKEMEERIKNFQEENQNLTSELESYKNKIQDTENDEVQKELQNLTASRNELIAIVQTKHQETLTYHAEIQRLSEILKQETEKNIQMENEIATVKMNTCPADTLKAKEEENEKLNDQVVFLRQKCDVLAQSMLEEQQRLETEKLASSEKEATLSKKLERLQSHLMEVEEHYTQELLQSEQKIALLQARLNEVEKREKDCSNVYTSVSIRANQQNEALSQQLQSMTSQRDDFRKKLLDLEDENNVKSAALTNLQLVLEQFQRDKDVDVMRETDRIRRQVKQEQNIQEDLRKEISNLENQMKESKQGLQAALRLTDQLEMSKNQISILREEVSVLNEKLHNKEEELKIVTSQTDGKVDKSLIKNLIIGFVLSNKNLNKDQKQILKIIATVLDFNEQDHSKVNLNQEHQKTWLMSLLSPMADDVPPNESLSRAFVNFLENESKPRIVPSLLPQSGSNETSSSVNSSTRTTPTPIVLNEIVLPTFSDFPQQRNSSSILKGVLKDNP